MSACLPQSKQQSHKSPTELLHSSFLHEMFETEEDSSERFLVRQVPGDGGCLFHALTVCLDYRYSKKHNDFTSRHRKISNKIRKLAVNLLMRDNDTLIMDNKETITSSQLLGIVADHYNMTTHEYCKKMVQPNTWGGGPEIVAISNHLKRPIHVYELSGSECHRLEAGATTIVDGVQLGAHKFKLCAKFGSPSFDHKAPLHILCADGRFPDIRPKQAKKVGDHFLALFPCDRSGKLVSRTLSEREEDEEQLRDGASMGKGGGGVEWWTTFLDEDIAMSPSLRGGNTNTNTKR